MGDGRMNRLRLSADDRVRRFDGGVVYLRVPAFVEELNDGSARYFAAMLHPYVGASFSTLHKRAGYGGRKGRRALRRMRLGLYASDKPKFAEVRQNIVLAETSSGALYGEWEAQRPTRFTAVVCFCRPGLLVESIRLGNMELLPAPVDAREIPDSAHLVGFPVLNRGDKLRVTGRNAVPPAMFCFTGLEAV